MLQFCQQCEVYHNVVTVNGQNVITECEKKINQFSNAQSSSQSGDIIYFNRHDFSPNSKTSFTSITAHLPPMATPQRNIKTITPPPQFSPVYIVKPQLIYTSVAYSPPPQPLRVQSPINSPNIRINFIQKGPPTTFEAPRKQVLLSPIPEKQASAFFKLKPKNLLSTIKEEIGNQSSRQRSLASIDSNETKPIVQEMRSIYKFKDLRRTSSDVKLQKAFQQKEGKENEDKNCWCW